MTNPGLIWRTIRQLTRRQLVFQVLTRLRSRPRLYMPDTEPTTYFLAVPDADKPISWQAGTFTFLNKSYTPATGDIRWNGQATELAGYGKLWIFNLNYFDFLNQPNVSTDAGLALILNFIGQTDSLRDGLASYPTSLRIMNWIQFLSHHQIKHEDVNRHLFAQTTLLSRRLEYHIAGNHLLENGYALLLSAIYFRHKRWFRKAAQLVLTELNSQILTDGGHDERSPMYHQLLLDRLLTVLLALQADEWSRSTERLLIDFLRDKAHSMLGWLNAITFRTGDIPMVNDATVGVAPTTAQLRNKAVDVLRGNLTHPGQLTDSGYRMFRRPRYELVANVGSPGSRHQPGHAHADTFSFVLYVDNLPLLVDKGTSTYQIGPSRTLERSTAAHNTVEVGGENSSEVWAGFRMGRRAQVTILTDTTTVLTARHNGYHHLGVVHERTWTAALHSLTITDYLISSRVEAEPTGVSRFYFHPTVRLQRVDNTIKAGPLQLSFSADIEPVIQLKTYDMAEGFNQLRTGQCIEVGFANRLETRLNFIE